MRSVNKYIVIIFFNSIKNQSNMNEIKNLVEQLIELTGIHGASVVPIRYALFFIIAIFLSWFSGWAGWYILRPIIQKIAYQNNPTQMGHSII